jgi:hypothetical protein
MSHPSKAAGTRWETRVVSYLARWWSDICRRELTGRLDKGDIRNGPEGWTLECKAEARINLPRYLREAKVEAENAGNPLYAAIVKNRRGKLSTGSVEDAFVVMPLHLWADYVATHEGDVKELAR